MAKKREGISKKTRFEVFKRDSFTCQYCGRSAPDIILHLDHIQPVSKDGEESTFNYITSCIDCNLGKSDRELSDNSVIKKQKAQLDELNERREQIEMMLEWRKGLKSLEEDVAQIAVDACNEVTPGWSVNEQGKQNLRKLIKKFGLETVLNAIEASKIYLKYDHEDKLTSESVNEAFDRLGGICRLSQQPDWKRELYYIRGILRKRCNYFNDWQGIQILEDAYLEGVDLEELRWIATHVTSWTNFKIETEDSVKRVRKEKRTAIRAAQNQPPEATLLSDEEYDEEVFNELRENGELDSFH